ncbi:MAG: M23 family metallopeptidase [Pyrinomonadaceae bacterium MAG19_C2-C3]|nr:M23 family metallopeptidase [Pyrinomonadaceae bacterium MAG19_C2-C3]
MSQPENNAESNRVRALRSRRVRLIIVAACVVAGVVMCAWYLGFERLIPVDNDAASRLPSTSNQTGERENDSGEMIGESNVAIPSPVVTASPDANLAASPEATPAPTVNANPFAEYNELARRDGSGFEASPATSASNLNGVNRLLIPVAGVSREQLIDTFTAARSEGRTHNALDIIAARGTPVLAATDGRLLRMFKSEKGGLAIYQIGADERTVYYYAHLDRYADNLSDGQTLRRGDVIGFVGDTGNSGAGNYHLHFAVWTVSDPKRFYEGENINPYPLFTR